MTYDWPTRLKRLRNATRLSQAKVARELGISAPSVAQWEIGRTKPSLDRLPAIARLYGVSLETLCGNDLGSPKEAIRAATMGPIPTKTPIAGYVAGADRIVLFEDGDCNGQSNDEIELPFREYDGLVLQVTGESMVPRYKPGEVIGITLPGKTSPSIKMLGRDVVVRLSDGQTVIKTLNIGPDRDSYVLTSVNPMVKPIYNPDIEWIAPIDFHIV
ncbi:LexA family transcriptional regulator [Acetobacter persici]|uniref:LexA family transcriptional regulator n=1 Tax=Acetobacter persici TaxID=1076596 RepID=UPI001BAC8745|nr:XRE family transcriptional regulator [Acetobacter persici]MBS1015180.1 helix-turn-helix transcriptional regulator [Acetobacter persici]